MKAITTINQLFLLFRKTVFFLPLVICVACSSGGDSDPTAEPEPEPEPVLDPPSMTISNIANGTLLNQTGDDYYIEAKRDQYFSFRINIAVPAGFDSGTKNGEPFSNFGEIVISYGSTTGYVNVQRDVVGGLPPEEFIVKDKKGNTAKIVIHLSLELGFDASQALTANWITTNFQTNESYTAISDILGTSSGSIIVLNEYSVHRSTDEGNSWTQTAIGPANQTYADTVTEHPDGTLYLSTFDPGKLLKSSDNGVSWSELSTNLPALSVIRSLHITENGTFFINAWLNEQNSTVNGVYKSDNGTDWTYLGDQGNIEYLFVEGNTNLYAYGSFPATLKHSVDSGATWNTINIPASEFIASFAIVNNNWYLGTDLDFYKSTDQGSNWSSYSSGLPDSKLNTQIVVSQNNEIYVNPPKFGVFKLVNDTWKSVGTDIGTVLITNMAFASGKLFAVSNYNNKVYKLE